MASNLDLADLLLAETFRAARAASPYPHVIDAHVDCVRRGERAVCVEIARVGHRIVARAWTQPRDSGDAAGRFELFSGTARCADDWERGC